MSGETTQELEYIKLRKFAEGNSSFKLVVAPPSLLEAMRVAQEDNPFLDQFDLVISERSKGWHSTFSFRQGYRGYGEPLSGQWTSALSPVKGTNFTAKVDIYEYGSTLHLLDCEDFYCIIEGNRICECGSKQPLGPVHSHWCPMYEVNP